MIPFNDSDLRKVFGEHPCSPQTGNAGADDQTLRSRLHNLKFLCLKDGVTNKVALTSRDDYEQ